MRSGLWLGAGLLLALALGGCGGASAPASSAPAAAQANSAAPSKPVASPSSPATGGSAKPATAGSSAAKPSVTIPAQPDRVKVAYLSAGSASSLPWIAKEAGFFGKYGIDADLQLLAPNVITQALMGGDLDVGYASSGNVPSAVAQGADLVMIGASYQGPIFSIVGKSDIDGIKGLQGKKLGVTSLGSTTDLLARQLIKDSGMTVEKDVSIVPLQNDAAELAGLSGGSVDAIVVSEPTTSITLSQGFKMIYDQSQQGTKSVGVPITVRKSYLASHRDMLERFLMANVQAVHMMKTQPDEAAKLTTKYNKTDPQILAKALRSIARITDDDLDIPMADLTEKLKVAAVADPKIAQLDPKTLVDSSLLDDLTRSGFIASVAKS